MDRTGIVVGKHSLVKSAIARRMRRQMTPAEAALWQGLRGTQLPGLHFRRQQVIDGFIADFYCHAVGLVVEVDGASHLARVEYDAQRSGVFAARGIRVLRFPNERVLADIDGVVAEIERVARGDFA